jgi:hypothetical protein
MNVYTFGNSIKQLKSRSRSYEFTSFTWGHSSLYPEESERESSDDEATSRYVGGGGGGVTTHIPTESSDEAFCINEGGGAVRQWLELPTSKRGGGAVQLEGEVTLP